MDIAQLFASMGMVPNTDIVNGQVVVLGQEESTYQTGMQESEYGQGPARFETEIEIAVDKNTEDDLREYVVGLQPDELLTLQQAFYFLKYSTLKTPKLADIRVNGALS